MLRNDCSFIQNTTTVVDFFASDNNCAKQFGYTRYAWAGLGKHYQLTSCLKAKL